MAHPLSDVPLFMRRCILAACILGLSVTALTNHLSWAFVLTLVVFSECAVLALNRGRCPLTDLAGRFTENRADNFDIYLPKWLARYNKAVFGTLFVVNEIVVLWLWLVRP